ncbi:MAG: MBL fold metallo-hydrolase [Gammaproteobacteria bacterium]|nr:MBL fold metallo-hydrolase [Gammaproteobacteria bacterium]NNC98188.1 MBL fold metallo-hydrolase [Gammaproteobacteria bacterium]NNM14864.1 MBL fold metallo-hydrolase [Gammaproteobacteria bacterium]
MQITFLGAAEEVTGSCYLIQTSEATVLLECGQKQGSRDEEEHNKDAFPFDIQQLDAVVISHAHIDHSGRLPLLVKQGYAKPIYTHQATRALLEIMLLDSGYIHEKDAEWENKQRQRKLENQQSEYKKNNQHVSASDLEVVEPLYTKGDAENTIPLIQGMNYSERIEVAKNLFVQFNDAGHILGSAIVEIWDESQEPVRKLVFSGDLGFSDAPIMQNPTSIAKADLVMLESTYGDRPHKCCEDTLQELGRIFKQAHSERGNVLIPSFAVGRSQDLLFLMSKYFKEWGLGHWNIFLDSPMAIRATQVYARFQNLYDARLFNPSSLEPVLPNLTMSMSTEESMQINAIKSGAIVIAGSGMCSGGRIHHHLKYNIAKANTHVIFVGYQAIGTLGRMIVDGAEKIKLWGEWHPVQANIHTVGGLSAHADQDGLIDWYSGFDHKPPVYLVHGESRAQQALQQKLQDVMAIEAQIAKYGDTVRV